jgi:hypothetical protein
MFHVGVSSPYPVAIRVVKLYEAEAVTVAWGGENSVCVRACAKHGAWRIEPCYSWTIADSRQAICR